MHAKRSRNIRYVARRREILFAKSYDMVCSMPRSRNLIIISKQRENGMITAAALSYPRTMLPQFRIVPTVYKDEPIQKWVRGMKFCQFPRLLYKNCPFETPPSHATKWHFRDPLYNKTPWGNMQDNSFFYWKAHFPPAT